MGGIIKVMPADFDQAAGDIARVSQVLDGCKSDMENTYATFAGNTQGKMAEKFSGYYTQLAKSFTGLTDRLDHLISDITGAKQAFLSLDQKTAKVIGDLASPPR
ncbi:MAG: WXG100 family type VII secretion target [Coriobacteriales bacterium]|nr:WXG100 family type VII secretion target [Coriobacteriales bacterium]